MQQPKSDSYPHTWQIRYKALVRRLVEIADDAKKPEVDSHVRILEYDLVARAHEERSQVETVAALEAEENDDALSSPLG